MGFNGNHDHAWEPVYSRGGEKIGMFCPICTDSVQLRKCRGCLEEVITRDSRVAYCGWKCRSETQRRRRRNSAKSRRAETARAK